MARVRAFLPIMKQANEDLSQRVLENPNSAGFEFVQIEENVDSANSDEEYDSEESEQEEEQHEGEEKKVIQMVRGQELGKQKGAKQKLSILS